MYGPAQPFSVFSIYDPVDESWLTKLEQHFSALRSQGLLFTQHVGMLLAGDEIEEVQRQDLPDMLGRLPLALDQAGAYIEETGCMVPDYIALWRTQRARLLQRRGALATHAPSPEHPDPVASTLSIDRVQTTNPAAADLLHCCAFLHPDHIPISLFIEGGHELGPTLRKLAAHPVAVDEAVQTLRSYSLLHRDPATQTLSLHRLVQAVLLDRMGKTQYRRWFERVVKSGMCVFPDPTEIITWPTCKVYTFTVNFLLEIALLQKINNRNFALLCNRAGVYLHYRGRYAAAEPRFQYAVSALEALHGPVHTELASVLSSFADCSLEMSKYERAESFYLRALHLNEQILGIDHPDMAMVMENYVYLLHKTQRDAEAAALESRAQAIRTKRWL